jgi:hypothetical protein
MYYFSFVLGYTARRGPVLCIFIYFMYCLALDDVVMYLSYDPTTPLATHIASGDLNIMENT